MGGSHGHTDLLSNNMHYMNYIVYVHLQL